MFFSRHFRGLVSVATPIQYHLRTLNSLLSAFLSRGSSTPYRTGNSRGSGRPPHGLPASADGDSMRMTSTTWEWIQQTGLPTAVLLFVAANLACAQEPVRSGNPSTDSSIDTPTPAQVPKQPGTEPDARSPLESLPAEIRYLPDKNGKLHAIPSNASLEGYLEFLARPRPGERDTVPAASVSLIELSGEANDDRVTLNARFVIQLRQTTEFVRVPLQLNEAVLVKRQYTGAGDVFFEKDRDQGLVYWIRGANPHVLELTLYVPVRRQLPTRKLQLTLPSSPISKLKLVVPHRSITAKASEKADEIPLEVTALDSDRSQIEAFGLGNRVDLTWQPNPEAVQSEAALEANTTILAQVDSDAVLLDVHQRIQSLQGKFDSFAVLLPAGAEILKIEDDSSTPRESRSEGYRDRKIDPARPNRVVVSLTGASVGPVRLRWTVRLPRVERRLLSLDGFVVESARKQSGEVGLAPHDGLRLSPVQHKDANILRINAAELKADVGGAQVTRAYRFLNQPFSLLVGVDPIEPYYLVEPRIFVLAAASQLTMDAVFQFQVYRESLTEVTFHWPEAKAEGWIIDGFDPPDLVQSALIEDDHGSFRVRLIKPQSSQFIVRLRARRAAKGNEDANFTLPRAKASSPSIPSFVVFNAENVETELTPRGETVIRPMPAPALEQLTIPESCRGLKSSASRVDTEEQAFALRVIPQPQRLRIESSSEATWQSDRIQVTQRIACNVSYKRLSQLKLMVPRSLSTDRIHFFADRGVVELPTEWSDGPDPQTRQVQLGLDSKIGRFEIQAQFYVRMPEDAALDGDTPVQIPILQSADEPYTQTRFALARADWFEASAMSEQWKPQPLRPDAWTWQCEGSRPEIGLRLSRSGPNANGTASVSRGLITATIGQDGRAMARAQFRISARSNSLVVAMPATSELPQFHWDRSQLVLGISAVEVPAGSKKYSLHLPDPTLNSGDRLLTIDYQLPNAGETGLPGTVELQSPQLPQCSWDAEVIWQTALLPNQHLFTYPATAAPMFRWRRIGLLWYRVSDPDFSRLENWIGVTSGPAPNWPVEFDSPQLASNLYLFSQIGGPRGLKFYTMSSPMIVLFGAGISFAFGFILLRVRALRHVLTVLTAGLILAAVGLWNSAPLELLMQPMIAGLLFPIAAVLIESWFRRSYGGTVLTLPTPAELAAAHGSRADLIVPQAGEQSTTLRPPLHDSSEALHVETGSGVS